MTAIRLATGDDAAAIAGIYRPAVTDLATSFELVPPDAAEMARRLAAVLARTPWLVCEHGGEVLGYAYGGRHRERPAYQWTVEVSAYVRSDVQRAGVGRGLYTSLLAALAVQGFRTAVAGITLPNPASVGLHEAVGFTPIGVYHAIGWKFGRWHDVAWFERPLGERLPEPASPRELPAVVGEPAFADALATGLACLRLA